MKKQSPLNLVRRLCSEESSRTSEILEEFRNWYAHLPTRELSVNPALIEEIEKVEDLFRKMMEEQS